MGALAQERRSLYEFNTRQVKIPNYDAKIEINPKNGDTMLVNYYKTQDPLIKTNNQFTKTYKGTPFFKNGWFDGSLRLDNGNAVTFFMAYNVQQGEIYVVTDIEKEATVIRPAEFTLRGHTFVRYKSGYYEAIYTDKSTLFKQYECKLELSQAEQKIGYETSGGNSEYEGVFIKSEKYYVNVGDKIKLIPLNKRFFKLFKTRQNEVQNYAKTHNIKPNKASSIIALFQYYDTLQ
jgi:hypothetical protein